MRKLNLGTLMLYRVGEVPFIRCTGHAFGEPVNSNVERLLSEPANFRCGSAVRVRRTRKQTFGVT